MPVYDFERVPAYLKTLTTLARERKYPLDAHQWDGAYRILKAPYYRLLYDERKAVAKPLTEKLQQAVEKQRHTMREKYGCKLCDTYYRKADQQWFKDGICADCRNAARSWNELLAWARKLVHEEPVILAITTEPAERPPDFSGRAPGIYYDASRHRALIDWYKPETFRLLGYEVVTLSGAVKRKVEHITTAEELAYVRHLVAPQPAPLVLMISPAAAEIAFVGATAGERARQMNPNLETLPMAWDYQARVGRTWKRILEIDNPHGHTERDYLVYACQVCGVASEATVSIAHLLRRFVLHLAEQEDVALDE